MKTGAWTAAAAFALAATACSAARVEVPPPRWTPAQAESVRVIRGTPVRVRRCTGTGAAVKTSSGAFYAGFRCLAGARLGHEAFDSVAVTYALRPLGRFRGPSSPHALADVRFRALAVP